MDYQKYLETVPRELLQLQAVASLALGFGIAKMLEMQLIHPDQANQLLYLSHREKVFVVVAPFEELRPEVAAQEAGMKAITVDELAMVLHEAGRRAVEAGQTVAQSQLGVKPQKFLEWDELTEASRNGRVIQAEYLLEHLTITRKE